jgi:hypothetical protein
VSAVENPVRAWLRLEAFVFFAAAMLVWIALDGGWLTFALMFFLPDLSFAAYLLGPRVGAVVYNLAHSYAIPAVIAVAGASLDQAPVILAGSLWTAHIGFDRLLGYGLKYPTGFSDTHLGTLGRARSRSSLSLNAS